MPTASLFERVVTITYVYLGPAADRFVSRQITNHLAKKPEQIIADDLAELIDWVRLAMSFLTEDQQLISEYIARLKTLERTYRAAGKPRKTPSKTAKRSASLTAHADAN